MEEGWAAVPYVNKCVFPLSATSVSFAGCSFLTTWLGFAVTELNLDSVMLVDRIRSAARPGIKLSRTSSRRRVKMDGSTSFSTVFSMIKASLN